MTRLRPVAVGRQRNLDFCSARGTRVPECLGRRSQIGSFDCAIESGTGADVIVIHSLDECHKRIRFDSVRVPTAFVTACSSSAQ